MAKASEQFRQSDVTTWGIVALVMGAIAVLGANVSAVIPSSVLGGLHKTRIEGASLEQLRQQVAVLREQTVELRNDNATLATRFSLEEQQGNEITRRVGALEVSLPRLLEALPENAEIDRTAVTASVTDDGAEAFEADGGSVVVRRQPLSTAQAALTDVQPLPAPLESSAVEPNSAAYGIALGAPVTEEQAPATWADLSMKLGPLLFGLSPMMVDDAESGSKTILAGPIDQLSDATSLCSRLERVSIACTPQAFAGTPLIP